MKSPTKKKNIYLDKKEFYQAIADYRKKCLDAEQEGKPKPPIPNYIGQSLTKLAEKIATMPCYMNYSYKEEMIGDGIINCIEYFDRFDPERSKEAFSYFTQVIIYAFWRRIYKENKNRYAMYKNFQETIIGMHDSSLLTDSDDNHLLPTQLYDNINDFMSRFEKKEEEKKAKRKQTKEGLLKFYEEDNNEGRTELQHSVSS